MNPYEAPSIVQNQASEPKNGAQASSSGSRRQDLGAIFFAFLPLLCLLPAYIFWLLMWVKLGHPPIPYRDDPKQLGAAASLCQNVIVLMSVASLMLALGDTLLFFGLLFVRFRTLMFRLQLLAIHLVSSGIMFLVMRLDPFQVFEWLMD